MCGVIVAKIDQDLAVEYHITISVSFDPPLFNKRATLETKQEYNNWTTDIGRYHLVDMETLIRKSQEPAYTAKHFVYPMCWLPSKLRTKWPNNIDPYPS